MQLHHDLKQQVMLLIVLAPNSAVCLFVSAMAQNIT
jgi:hypothetical protein